MQYCILLNFNPALPFLSLSHIASSLSLCHFLSCYKSSIPILTVAAVAPQLSPLLLSRSVIVAIVAAVIARICTVRLRHRVDERLQQHRRLRAPLGWLGRLLDLALNGGNERAALALDTLLALVGRVGRQSVA